MAEFEVTLTNVNSGQKRKVTVQASSTIAARTEAEKKAGENEVASNGRPKADSHNPNPGTICLSDADMDTLSQRADLLVRRCDAVEREDAAVRVQGRADGFAPVTAAEWKKAGVAHGKLGRVSESALSTLSKYSKEDQKPFWDAYNAVMKK